LPFADTAYDNDFAFKNAAKEIFGNTVYSKNDWSFFRGCNDDKCQFILFFLAFLKLL
jgi:hypothetical protein